MTQKTPKTTPFQFPLLLPLIATVSPPTPTMELSTTNIKPPTKSFLCFKNRKPRNNPPNPPPTFSLNDLDDILLIEILHRVATPKVSARCKAVCNRWRSLISTPYFITRFIRFHACFSYYQKHSTALLTFTSQISRNPSIFITTNAESFSSLDLKFSSLPEREGSVRVVASCNDLLLLSGDKALYVHNPFTRQSVAISLISKGYAQYGLVSEPYYFRSGVNKDGDFELNDEFQFAVICFTEEIDIGCYVVDVYCPKSGKKKSNFLSGSNKNYQFCSNVVACTGIGKLCWYNGSQIVVFDPFNPITQTFFIDASALNLPYDEISFCDHCIGVSRGEMKIMQLVIYSYENRETTTLSIWRLQDYMAGKWSLEYRFNFHVLVVRNPWFVHFMNGEEFHPKVLGFHPSDDDIVFLDMKNCVLLCGLRDLKLKVAGKILSTSTSYYDHDSVFPLMQPWWPSPLVFDAPAQNAKNGGTFTCFSV